jgi:hypothetical protein
MRPHRASNGLQIGIRRETRVNVMGNWKFFLDEGIRSAGGEGQVTKQLLFDVGLGHGQRLASTRCPAGH